MRASRIFAQPILRRGVWKGGYVQITTISNTLRFDGYLDSPVNQTPSGNYGLSLTASRSIHVTAGE